MWTPRRVGLLLLGVALFGSAFLAYSLVLGGFDGLPALPEAYLKKAEGQVIPRFPVSDTVYQLQQAFGPASPEGGTDLDYVNRLQLNSKDEVIACGSPVTNGTPFVSVSPISLALFGKPPARRLPGQVPEISTFHADKAVLRFDRPIAKREEMFGPGAKVIGVELVSEPDDNPNVPTDKKDKRKGRIWISHNRKSPDPADHIVVRTPGPVFVQMPDDAAPHDPNVPHVWTSAAVEVFDRQNLPRKLRKREPGLTPKSAVTEVTENILPVAAMARPDDLRRPGAIADILTGETLPPPTVVCVGLKVYLKPSKREPAPPKPADGRQASFSGVREILLCDRVQMNLWTDGTSGFPGAEPAANKNAKSAAAPVPPNRDPPLAAAGVIGGLLDAGTLADRLENRSLLLIETPGAFRYNLQDDTATFDVAADPPPGEQNYVVVTRLSARNQTDYLVCSKLLLEFLGQRQQTTAATPEPPAEGGLAIRAVTAFGPQVLIEIESEGLKASGAELRYVRDPGRTVTTLKGTPAAPVIAHRDGSKLTADDPVNPSQVEIVTTETAAKEKMTVVSVTGPGRLELLDEDAPAADRRGSIARWAKWLKHEKIARGGKSIDLLKFEENAAFVDPQAGFTLRSQSIWLWVAAADKKPTDRPADPTKPAVVSASPERLVATGEVEIDSPDLVVRDTHKLTVWFRDDNRPRVPKGQAPAAAVAATPPATGDAPLPAIPPPPGVEPPAVATAAPPPPEPKPNPLHLKADTVETWVVRFPVEEPKPAAPGKPAAPPRLKYDLEKARCDDNVRAHQDPDPNDPNKPANGIDIAGDKLTLDHAPPNGSVLTVSGGRNKDDFAAVTFEDTTIYGPVVVIDQPNNTVAVDGRGRLKVVSGSDVQGNDLSTPSDLQVDFNRRMWFDGAKAFATFVGGVVVHQVTKPDPAGRPAAAGGGAERLPPPRGAGPAATAATKTNVWCHQLDLTLDRPVYFNQLQKDDRAGRDKKGPKPERPKVRNVVALPKTEAGAEPHEKVVIFRELAVETNGPPRGRLLTARQLDFANRTADRDWLQLDATGPGELRLLQPESNGEANRPVDPNVRVAAKGGEKDAGELKLTVVQFGAKMVAKDQANGAYQEAKFDDGAVVMNTPAANVPVAADPGRTAEDATFAVMLVELEPHKLPAKSVYLTCRDLMTVSSTRPRRDAAAEQRLTAVGNAVFRDDTRTGLGDRIVYDGTRAVLDGDKRLASLQSNKRGINTDQSMQAKRFVYNSKSGQVEVQESAGGTFGTGR